MTRDIPAAGTAIRARIHDSAIKRVTRFFSSSLSDIFTETFQNARRAGARHIHVIVAPAEHGSTITVTDDGDGIPDPAVLLSFGENGWSPDLVHSEDAAGMGFIALARRGCTVRSRPRSANCRAFPGWTVSLQSEHFSGESEATVHRDDHAPWPHGTAISFPSDDGAHAIRIAAATASRYLPIPVHLDGLPDSPDGGEELDRRTFLDGAIHLEHWQGLALGVFRNRRRPFGEPDTNFHGVTVSAGLPEITAANDDAWSVLVDIRDCPRLALVLPARREVVQTPFLDELRRAATLCIYRAMARQPHPDPAFDDWQRARAAGIRIAPARRRLKPWKPAVADHNNWREPTPWSDVPSGALLMNFEPEAPEAQTLHRALAHADISHQVFQTARRLEGYDWYDNLDRVLSAPAEALDDGDYFPIPDNDALTSDDDPVEIPDRPAAILVKLCIHHAERGDRSFTMAADLAFAGEPYASIDEIQAIVTRNSELQPHDLSELLYAAYFSPSDDSEADSWETQSERFRADATTLATELLCGKDEALRQAILHAANRDLRWIVPPDGTAVVTIRDRNVTVSLDTRQDAA